MRNHLNTMLLFVFLIVLQVIQFSSCYAIPPFDSQKFKTSTSFPVPAGAIGFIPMPGKSPILLGSPDTPIRRSSIKYYQIPIHIATLPSQSKKVKVCDCQSWVRNWVCSKDMFFSSETKIGEILPDSDRISRCLSACSQGVINGKPIKEGEMFKEGEKESCSRFYDAHGQTKTTSFSRRLMSVNAAGSLIESPGCPRDNITCIAINQHVLVRESTVEKSTACSFEASDPIMCTVKIIHHRVVLNCNGLTAQLTGRYTKQMSCSGQSMYLTETSQSLVFALPKESKSNWNLQDEESYSLAFAHVIQLPLPLGDKLPAQFANILSKAEDKITHALRQNRALLTSISQVYFATTQGWNHDDLPTIVIWDSDEKPYAVAAVTGAFLVQELEQIQNIRVYENKEGWMRWPIEYDIKGMSHVGFMDLSTGIAHNHSRYGISRETALLRVNETHSCLLNKGCAQFVPILSQKFDFTAFRFDLNVKTESYTMWEIEKLKTEMIGIMATLNPVTRELTLTTRSDVSNSASSLLRIGIWSVISEAPWYMKAGGIAAGVLAALSVFRYGCLVYSVLSRIWRGEEVYVVPKGTSARKRNLRKRAKEATRLVDRRSSH